MKGLASADAEFRLPGEVEGIEGSRPRRERCEGVRGMSVIWSFDLRVGNISGRRGWRA
jgi:hypothetical protein